MKAAIKNYSELRFKTLSELLHSYLINTDPETIHQIRVEFKKLRAVRRIIRETNKKFNYKKSGTQLRDIYRAAKKIREPQVMQSLAVANKLKKVPAPFDTTAVQEAFKKSIPDYIKIVEEQQQYISKHLRHIEADGFKKYISRRGKELKKSLYPTFNLSELHTTRKRIKDIHYLQPLGNKKQSPDPFFEQAAALIGDWHDHVLLIQWARKTGSVATIKRLQTANRNRIKKLRQMVAEKYGRKAARKK